MSARSRRWPRRLLRALALAAALAGIGAALAALWLRSELRASRARLDGRQPIAGLEAEVTVERDALGVPTIRGSSRADVARATGFLHAQERFFQMDLLRRRSAGELAALVGAAALPQDRNVRRHLFRERARRTFDGTDAAHRALLEAYVAGVNAGLAALGSTPPEYLVLRATPEAWRHEDTILVLLSMYLTLQYDGGRRESNHGVLHDLLPEPMVRFLTAAGSEWDAPLVGPAVETPPIPGPEVFDLRRHESGSPAALRNTEPEAVGSNSWAVAGKRTEDGGALVANDMHLGLGLPNIWYRARMLWPDAGAPGGSRAVTGVTLPGAPMLIAGSNGRIAWGFTNSQGDFDDLVVLEPAENADEASYRTPEGARGLETRSETIEVRGGNAERADIRWTEWGPLIDTDYRGRRRALRWVAHDERSSNLHLLEMETSDGVETALQVAARAGIPTQNVVVADDTGRIGYTLMGPVPRRVGFSGQRPESWADGSRRWDGYLDPPEYPRILDPEEGLLWTANNRVLDEERARLMGDGGFAEGARARQIRDGLRAIERATPADMLQIQLDDRALFLERWRTLLLELLTPRVIDGVAARGELRRLVAEDRSGRAAADSSGYLLVREFRRAVAREVLDAITAPCRAADERFDALSLGRFEGPLWAIVSERPAHLLAPRYRDWDEQLVAAVDRVIAELAPDETRPLGSLTWGERNRGEIRHPLSLAVPALARWLDAPSVPLPGDGAMPRVQGSSFGASQRMVVSPGREEAGLFHMPGGQSGHFLSPFYLAGHSAWERGEPAPFLPGPTVHRLLLVPR